MTDSHRVVCPHCDGVNRVPEHRDAAEAKCGKCHKLIFDKHPLSLDASRFDRHVGRSDVPVLVDFWATWCAPCRMMAPEFEKAAAALSPRVRLAKVDTEENPMLSSRYNIRSIPTLVLFKGGEIARMSGALSSRDLVDWTQQNL
jgi:thioredoxin 2